MKKNLKLGLFGFGCVGQGLYHVLHETHGIKAEIKKICVKNKLKSRPIDEHFFTYEKEEILNDPEIDIVVELIDDASAAFEIVKTALQHGKAVVTANKKMLAEHLEEIYNLQKKHGKPVLYEGAVCGSIPILRNLEEYYDNDLISSIEGIFNGSTNYILTKVFEEKKSYAEALRKAQELGFAESDPSLDVKGFDPKFKLVIAIAHTFGLFVQPEEVINIGIDRISDLDLKFAQENNYAIKLIARAFKSNGKVYGFVAPQFIDNTNPLATVRNEFNAVQVRGAFAETQLFIGKGAGSYPTGSAVLSDISALAYDYTYEYKKHHQDTDLVFSNDLLVEAFVSFDHLNQVSISDFDEFKSGYAAQGKQYMVGKISLQKLQSLSKLEGVGIILAPKAIVAESATAAVQLAVA
ncbi:homoserine dehydrogenase [Fulvivirgaceae bacterium PWU4]|uniref:Homoserine dehydrogenase n=1 Tax=Chryseosolibacter histidini TaxID=2782349 RepID=A0AAP2DJD8_9BACT|nr:homoserine dehydrogenase [Chryseosolibacter histidini]MBT1696478.1 homoserine dehydrogenase [Chryseosolibacter histidini]